MRKSIVFISLATLSVCVVRLVFPASPFQVLGINAPVAWIGFSVSSFGILFEWHMLQQLNLRLFFHSLSIILFGLTVFAALSPTYDGLLSSYVHFADNFVTFESATLLWLLGSEQHRKSFPVMLYIGFTSELLIRNFSHKLRPILYLHRSHAHVN